MENNIEVGDLVVNQQGWIMAVERVDGEEIVAFYECNPSMQHRYKMEEVRLLKKGGSIHMSAFNSGEFAARIERQMSWAKNVRGLPAKYREKKTEQTLEQYTVEELEELLEALKEIKGEC